MKKIFLSLIFLITLISCSAKDANLLDSSNIPANFKKTANGVYLQAEDPNVFKKYRAFHVNPINIYQNDKGRLVIPTDIEVTRLAMKFREQIIRDLGSRYTPFDQPARDVAIIDIKVVDIWSSRTIEAIRPGIIFPNNLGGGATMEASFYDTVSKAKVATVWDSRPGKRQGFFSGLTKWGNTEEAFKEWSILLKKSIRSSAY